MDRTQAVSFFTAAGIKVCGSWELVDQYHRGRGTSWWLVKTPQGMVRIGWRKRVVEIDWSDTPVRRLVGKDDVTKTETLIHAWSVGKVVEYLSELASELNSDVLKDVLPHLEDLRAHHSHSASSEEEATSWEAVARLIQTIKHDTVRVR